MASYNEFMQVEIVDIDILIKKIKNILSGKRPYFRNTIKDRATLSKIKQYKPLMTYDNSDELTKIKDHCETAGLIVRLKVPDTGSQVEMSSKFGAEPADAQKLIQQAFDMGLNVEGISFHVGSQCTNFDNFTAALAVTSEIFNDARKKGFGLNLVDIGGGFRSRTDPQVPEFTVLASLLNSEFKRLFPDDIEILANLGGLLLQLPQRSFQKSSAKPAETERFSIISMTVCIILFPESCTIIGFPTSVH